MTKENRVSLTLEQNFSSNTQGDSAHERQLNTFGIASKKESTNHTGSTWWTSVFWQPCIRCNHKAQIPHAYTNRRGLGPKGSWWTNAFPWGKRILDGWCLESCQIFQSTEIGIVITSLDHGIASKLWSVRHLLGTRKTSSSTQVPNTKTNTLGKTQWYLDKNI